MANTSGPETLLRLRSYLKFLSSNNAPTARSIGRYNVPPNLHASSAFFAQTGTGTVRMCFPLPIRSAITQCSSAVAFGTPGAVAGNVPDTAQGIGDGHVWIRFGRHFVLRRVLGESDDFSGSEDRARKSPGHCGHASKEERHPESGQSSQ